MKLSEIVIELSNRLADESDYEDNLQPKFQLLLDECFELNMFMQISMVEKELLLRLISSAIKSTAYVYDDITDSDRELLVGMTKKLEDVGFKYPTGDLDKEVSNE